MPLKKLWKLLMGKYKIREAVGLDVSIINIVCVLTIYE